jgi:hypothetical protein
MPVMRTSVYHWRWPVSLRWCLRRLNLTMLDLVVTPLAHHLGGDTSAFQQRRADANVVAPDHEDTIKLHRVARGGFDFLELEGFSLG